MEMDKKFISSAKSQMEVNRSSAKGWMSNKGITVVFNIGPSFFHLLTKNKFMKRSFNYLFDSREKMNSFREKLGSTYPKLPVLHKKNSKTSYSKLSGKNSSVVSINIYKENCICEKCLTKSFLFFGSLPSDLHKEILRILQSEHCADWNITWINILIAQLKIIFTCIKDGIIYEKLLECANQCARVLQKVDTHQETSLHLLEYKYSYEFFHLNMRKEIELNDEIVEKNISDKILPLLPFSGLGKEEIDIIDGVTIISFETEQDMVKFTSKELNYLKKMNISSKNDDQHVENENLLKKAESLPKIRRWKTRNLYPTMLSDTKIRIKRYDSKDILPEFSTKSIFGLKDIQHETVSYERSSEETSTNLIIKSTPNKVDNVCNENISIATSSSARTENRNIRIDHQRSSDSLLIHINNQTDLDHKSATMNDMQTYTAKMKKRFYKKLNKKSKLSKEMSPVLRLREQWLLNSQGKSWTKLPCNSMEDDCFYKKLSSPDYWKRTIIPVFHNCSGTDIQTCSCKTFSLGMVLIIGRERPLSKEAIANLEALKLQSKIDYGKNTGGNKTLKGLLESSFDRMQEEQQNSKFDIILDHIHNRVVDENNTIIKRPLILHKDRRRKYEPKEDVESNVISERMAHIAASALLVNNTITRIVVPVVSETILNSFINWNEQLSIDRIVSSNCISNSDPVAVDPVIRNTVDDIIDYVELKLNPIDYSNDPDNCCLSDDEKPRNRRKRKRRSTYLVPAQIQNQPCKCKKRMCRKGCICYSINRRKSLPQHCAKLSCMFECICSNDDEESKKVEDDIVPCKTITSHNSKHRTQRERKFPSKFQNSVCFAFEDDFHGLGIKPNSDKLYKPIKTFSVKQQIMQHKLKTTTEYSDVRKTLNDVLIWCDRHSKYECKCFSWICKLKENVLLWKAEKRYKQNTLSDIWIGPNIMNEIKYYVHVIHCARTYGAPINYKERNATEIFKLKRYRELRKGILSSSNSYVKLNYCNVVTRKDNEIETMKEDIVKAVSSKNIRIQFIEDNNFIDVGQFTQLSNIEPIIIEEYEETGSDKEQFENIPENNHVIDHSTLDRMENIAQDYEPTSLSCRQNTKKVAKLKLKRMNLKRKIDVRDYAQPITFLNTFIVEKETVTKKNEEVGRLKNIPDQSIIASTSTLYGQNYQNMNNSKKRKIDDNGPLIVDLTQQSLAGKSIENNENIPKTVNTGSSEVITQRLRCAPTYKLLDPRIPKEMYESLVNPSAITNVEVNIGQNNEEFNKNTVSMDNNQVATDIHRYAKITKFNESLLKKKVIILRDKKQKREVNIKDLNNVDQPICSSSSLNTEATILPITPGTIIEQSEKLNQHSERNILTVDLTKETPEENSNILKVKYLKRDQKNVLDLKQLTSDSFEKGLISMKDKPIDIYGPDNLPKLALLCMTPGIGYLPIVQYNQDVLVVQDPRFQTLFHSFKNLDSANLWFNRFLKNQIAFENKDTNLKWIVVKPGVLKIRHSHPFSASILKNPSLIITKDCKLKLLPEEGDEVSNIRLTAMEFNVNPTCNVVGRLLFENKISSENTINLNDEKSKSVTSSSNILISQPKKMKLTPILPKPSSTSAQFVNNTNTKLSPIRLKILNANKQKVDPLNLNTISAPYMAKKNTTMIVSSSNTNKSQIYFGNRTPQILSGLSQLKGSNFTTSRILKPIRPPEVKVLTNKLPLILQKRNVVISKKKDSQT